MQGRPPVQQVPGAVPQLSLAGLTCRDTVIYSASCPKLGNKRVAVKMYDKHKVQPTKYRAIKREIAMMMYFTNKR